MAFGDDKKKPDLALLIGGGAKAPGVSAEDAGGDRRSLAEKAFAKAVRRGDGIADAFEELLNVVTGDDEDDELEADPMDEPSLDEGF